MLMSVKQTASEYFDYLSKFVESLPGYVSNGSKLADQAKRSLVAAYGLARTESLDAYQHYFRPYWYLWATFGAILAIFVLWWAFKRIRRHFAHKRYACAALEHRKRQREAIAAFLLAHPAPGRKLCEDILDASVSEIVANTKGGRWSVEEVVLAYCHSAIAVHEELNCLTEILFESALERARELDSRPHKEGALFGVPVSVKDCIHIKGVPSSAGIFRWKDEVMTENAKIVDQLIAAGAVPFCKTNVPQTMMTFESGNPLWGTTENPVLKGFTPGGSSSGEAALIGASGSVLGVGSDIGGSLRIPAHFSGICALKPSHLRLPSKGSRGFRPDHFIIEPVNGPMARTVDDLVAFMEVTCGGPAAAHEPPIVPFKALKIEGQKMRVGIVRNLPYLQALPPCVRAVDETVAALQAEGHEIVEFNFPFLTIQLVSLMYETVSADGGHYYIKSLGDEPIEECLKPFMFLLPKSSTFLGFCAWLASGYADRRPMLFLDALGRKDAVAMLRMLADRNNLVKLMNSAWDAAGIDFLVMPAFACPAPPHGAFPNVSFAASYTFIWNILDYVAGVVPTTIVDAEKDKVVMRSDDTKTDSSKRLLEAELEHAFDAEKMAGLPVGVQIVTPRFQEAKALCAMKIVESAIHRH